MIKSNGHQEQLHQLQAGKNSLSSSTFPPPCLMLAAAFLPPKLSAARPGSEAAFGMA